MRRWLGKGGGKDGLTVAMVERAKGHDDGANQGVQRQSGPGGATLERIKVRGGGAG